MLNKIIKFFLENKLVTVILLVMFITWGVVTSPFQWETGFLPQDPVPVDAIPDIGENQQIVFTKWQGRSPQDIEDQITYPLTTALLGIPGVKTIRSSSMFGFSSIYIIFKDGIEFYWSRSRILEKLNSLPSNLLPENIKPTLGPDATALGQIFWYTLEGKNKAGETTGGWDLHELRSIQDYQVRYGLASVDGVSEVASIGGYIKEYQVDIDPVALHTYNVNIMQVMNAVQKSNLDIGARTIEINQAEYYIRGIGYIKKIEDIELSVIKVNQNTPIRVKDVAKVTYGPAERRGVLDKDGAEVVGGVVVARFGANPLDVINNVKNKIAEISPGLPSKILRDGTVSKLKIVPFYDRSTLIKETLGTLNEALTLEIIITIIVIIIMVFNMRASILISALIPIAVLMTFTAMRYFGVDANIVALSGIAIAIGTIVDVGIVLSENMIQHLEKNKLETRNSQLTTRKIIYEATIEVAPAVITAVLTTIVSFIPVFAMEAAEGKLFRPLAFTKTFVLLSALIVAITILPALAHWLFSIKITKKRIKLLLNITLSVVGIVAIFILPVWLGIIILILGLVNTSEYFFPHIFQSFTKKRNPKPETRNSKPATRNPKPETRNPKLETRNPYQYINFGLIALGISYFLTREWLPLGASNSMFSNFMFVIFTIAFLLGVFLIFIKYYQRILSWALDHKKIFIGIPALLVLWGAVIWIGWANIFGFVPKGFDMLGMNIRQTKVWSVMQHSFPGIGKEFMPSLDEGSFLLMPTSMPHSGIEENKRVLKQLDMAVSSIPEIESVVGKLGRVNSPLDPAPISMYENVINYKPEYKTDENGKRLRFAVDENGNFLRNKKDELIQDANGEYFRQWRDEIKSPDDIWNLIVEATRLPGVTSAPKLQPIETRLIMLQTGMRAPIGIRIYGDDLDKIQDFGLELEKLLKEIPSVKKASVFADRIVGKPYIELTIDRKAISRYGLTVNDVQHNISIAIGGIQLGSTVEGRERYPIRVRYPRELRDSPETIENILISTRSGTLVPLKELAKIEYKKGPQVIKSENTFLIGYVIFDKNAGYSEVDVVEDAQKYIQTKIDNKELEIPSGISYVFTGNYENQVRAEKRLAVVIPVVFIIIFLILYFQFKKIPTTLMVFSGISVAFAGGFIMIWLFGQGWFMNFDILGINIRELFQMKPVFLSVAVWVGFIALFGIATDDGVLMTTYMEQVFDKNKPSTVEEIRKSVIEAGSKRIRPCLMTTATTILALLPILTSSGRGSDVMIPMAIPAFGGMTFELITLFVIPVIYSLWRERKLRVT